MFCSHFKVCDGSSSSPSPKEMYDVVLKMKKNGVEEFQTIEDYLSEYKTIEKEISSLRFESEEDKKKILQWYKDENIFLSNFDMHKKTDEEVQAQIVEMMEKDDSISKDLAKLGKTLEEKLKGMRELAMKEIGIEGSIKKLEKDLSVIKMKEKALEEIQIKMYAVINLLSNKVKDTYGTSNLQDQEIIKKQVQLGLLQYVTDERLNHLSDMLVTSDLVQDDAFTDTELITQYSKYIHAIEFSATTFKRMNRYEFNLLKSDHRMEIFLNSSSIEFAIDKMFEMAGQLETRQEETCDERLFKYLTRLINLGITMRKIALRIKGREMG